MKLEGKDIIILGAGRSGRAAAALAAKHGAMVRVYDASTRATFEDFPEGVKCFSGATAETGLACACDLLVISPGIDTYGGFVCAFEENAGEMIGETELAARFYQGKIIAITGTNGKTTTTELIERIMQHSGASCVACGNYGIPFAEVLLREELPDVVSLELSSFQLETVRDFHADVAVWLNFSADHMDRYKAIEDYFEAKRRVFINQTSADYAIIRCGEKLGELVAQTISFTTEHTEGEFSLVNGHVCVHGEPVIDMKVTRMRGLHNAENAMAAVAACHCLGVSYATAAEAMHGFAPPLHRCELVRTLDGVEYLNDSKATNIHALDSALRSQDRPVVLIAGGKQKGLDYAEILPRLKHHAHAAVVFGEISASLEQLFNQVIPCQKTDTLDDALQLARRSANHGDVVLFSPGTSSFDQYTGYEARGDHFRALVHALK